MSLKNNLLIEQELESLNTIYPDYLVINEYENKYRIEFTLSNVVTVIFEINENYPLNSLPNLVDIQFHQNNRDLRTEYLSKKLENLFSINCGNECLFQAIQIIQEYCFDEHNLPKKKNSVNTLCDDLAMNKNTEEQEEKEVSITSTKSNKKIELLTNPPSVSLFPNLNIVHGEITKKRKSAFQSHLCTVKSIDEVKEFRNRVLSDRRIAQAAHNILAYRFTFNGIDYHDYDDDGETAAGGRLAEMMRLMKLNNVAVIVSRWFGGILLGPDRFKYICNSARKLIEEN
jgi:hypothetical protein